MKIYVLLLLVLGCTHIHGAPLGQDAMTPGSCDDPHAVKATHLALTKINQDRQEGYIFTLNRLSNVHLNKHTDTGVVYYLDIEVVETNCSVVSKKDWKNCEARPTSDTPVYGLCQAAIYIDKVNRVVRLYKYDCAIRPVPAARISEICPDCPAFISVDNAEVQKTVSRSLEKFNKESGLNNRFALLNVTRASAGYAMKMYYNVEYTIQETTCTQSAGAADNCDIMTCEFAHKGFCKASLFNLPTDEEDISVKCEIYEPEAADREKKLHLQGEVTDHSHNDTQTHSPDHDSAHPVDKSHTHDHVHDHTKSHSHHDVTHKHADDSEHHHTHDHAAGTAHRHAHDHSHDHGHGHDHVHAHHAKAHDHSRDFPNQHHDYKHADGVHTHEHDHELALDHDHKHAHLHEHEHHHHHHDHEHETGTHDHPEGMVRILPPMDQPLLTLLPPPVVPTGGAPKPDPQIPGATEPTLLGFPVFLSAQCPHQKVGDDLVHTIFTEDNSFRRPFMS